MRASAAITFLAFAFLFAGCAETTRLIADGNVRILTAPLSAAPAYETEYSVQIEADPAAAGESVFCDPAGRRFAVGHVAWSEALAEQLEKEMKRRGIRVGDVTPNRVRVRINEVKSEFSGRRVEVSVAATLSLAGKTWTKTCKGSDKVLYSAVLAFQGAVENLLINILQDKTIFDEME